MRTHNEDLRQRIVAARAMGHSAAELARLFGISKRSVERFWKQHQATGSVKPKQRGGYRRSRLAAHDAQLRAWINAQADLTLSELQARLQKELGIALGITALWHRLEWLGLSYKKKRCPPRSKSGPTLKLLARNGDCSARTGARSASFSSMKPASIPR